MPVCVGTAASDTAAGTCLSALVQLLLVQLPLCVGTAASDTAADTCLSVLIQQLLIPLLIHAPLYHPPVLEVSAPL
jgi:hypothetical protein